MRHRKKHSFKHGKKDSTEHSSEHNTRNNQEQGAKGRAEDSTKPDIKDSTTDKVKSSTKSGRSKKNENLKFLIPVIVLLVFALLSWSWMLLALPNISNSAEPFINKYLKGLMDRRQAPASDIITDSSTDISIDNSSVSEAKGDSSHDSEDDSKTINKDDDKSATTQKDEKRPTIKLQIYEGPTYSNAGDICFYRIKAIVTGDPNPVVKFSKDDSNGTAGPNSTQINLTRSSKTYTLTATASNAYGTVMDSMSLVWGCNSNPVISEVKLSNDIIYVSKQYDISVSASDPDGDKITYKWTVSGGSLDNDSFQSVKWTTPSSPDNYNVKIEVTDIKGAKTSKTISVYVGSSQAPETTAKETSPSTTATETTAPPTTTTSTEQQSQSLNVPKKTGEGGYVEYGGNTYAGGNVYAGDSASNKPCAGFISFDISSLKDKTIQSVKLTLSSATVYGKPLEYLDALWINVVSWGAEPIEQNDFKLSGIAIQSFASSGITCNADKLKSELQEAIDDRDSRFQVRIHFAGPYTDNDSARDGWEYLTANINLNVTY